MFSNAITLNLGPEPPVFTAPASGTTLPKGHVATFTWTAVAGAAQYVFEFTGPGVAGSVPVGSTTLMATVPATLASGSYQLRVMALSAGGQALTGFGPAITVILQ